MVSGEDPVKNQRSRYGENLDPQGYLAHLIGQLKMSGQMPLYSTTPWKNRLHAVYVAVVWTWVLLHFLTQLSNIMVHRDDLLVIVKTLSFIILIFNQICRGIVIITRKDTALSILDEMSAKFRRVSEDGGPERATIKNWERAGILMFKAYWTCGAMCVPTLVLNPLISRMYFGLPDRNSTGIPGYDILPTNAWYPFDALKGQGYVAAYLFQSFPVLFVAFSLLVTDCCMYSTVLITCGQLHLLIHEIKYIRQTAEANVISGSEMDGKIYEEKVQQEMERLLKVYAKKHGEVLRFIDILENITSPCMLANSRVLTVCIVSTSFEILNSEVLTVPRLMGQGVYFCSAFMQVLAYCWNSDLLNLKQEELHWELYQTPWLEASQAYRKLMLTVAERARTDVMLTVGKIAPLNKVTYIGEVHRSFSVFNAMLQLRDKQ